MSSRPSRGAARLAAILDALPDALLLVNCNGTVVNANHIALETFEVPGTGLVGRGLLDLLPDFDSRRIPGGLRPPRDDANGGRTKPTRMIARRTDGTQFPVEVTSANLDGRTPYAEPHASYDDELLMLVVRDLTGTVDTEAELARSQRQTEMILRAAAEGVVGVDTAGKVVLVNPSAAQILGYRASDLGGRELHPLIHHSRTDGTPFPYEESPIADTLRSGRKHRVRGQVLWAKDGRAVPVDLTTAPVRDGDQLVGAVMTFTDRRPYDALAARHAQLLATLDGSLRGPLDQLRAELGTLADDPAGQLWPEANQILHHLAAGYARMTTLVDNVLAYQRLDAGQDKLDRKKVKLDEVVAAGVDGAVELIGPGRAQFAVHAPAIEAEVDAGRFAQALAHLIADVAGVDATGSTSTSASGSGAGSGDSTIVVAAAQRGDVVRVEVRGPYPGGDPVHGPLVRGIVRRHGGVLQTHDLPGTSGGKAYVLEVPVSAEAGPVPASAQPQGPDTENLTTVMPMPTQRARGMSPDAEPQGGGLGQDAAQSAQGGGRRARRAEAPADGTDGAETGGTDAGTAPTQQPTGRRRGPARPEEDSGEGGSERPGAGLVPPQATGAPTGRRARREAAGEAPGSAFALPPAEADRPAEAAEATAPTGRRARRGVAEAAPEAQIPSQATDESSAPRTPFALPPADADRTPESPAPPADEPPAYTPRGGTDAFLGSPRPTRPRPNPGPAEPTAPGAGAVAYGPDGVPVPAGENARPQGAGNVPTPRADDAPTTGGGGVPVPGAGGAPMAGQSGAPVNGAPVRGAHVVGPGGVPASGADGAPAAGGMPVPGAGGAPAPGPGNATTNRAGGPGGAPAAGAGGVPVPGPGGTAVNGPHGTGPAGAHVAGGVPVPGGVPMSRADGGPAAVRSDAPGPVQNPAQVTASGSTPMAVADGAPAAGQGAAPAAGAGGVTVPGQDGGPAGSSVAVPGAGGAGTGGATAPARPGPDVSDTYNDGGPQPQGATVPGNGGTPTHAGPAAGAQSTEGEDGSAEAYRFEVPPTGGEAAAPAPTGRRRARRALAEEPGAAPKQAGAEAPGARPISVRMLGQGPGTSETPAHGTPSAGSGRRRKLANPAEGEREAQAAQTQAQAQVQARPDAPAAPPAPATPATPTPAAPAAPPAPGNGTARPHPLGAPEGRAFAIGAPDEGAEGPEPLDGPNGAVEVVEAVRPPMDDELPPEPLDNPRRLLVWPAPDESTEKALTERGYRPVIVHSREEVNAQIAAYPAALFVDPLTGPITRTALQSLREAAVAAEVPVLVTAGLGHATREAAYGADPAVLLKALAPRDSEMHPPRVLLIEEHEPIANALTATLERRGMHVVCGATDAEAVTLAAQTRPNLVVMDLMQVRRRRAGIVDWLRGNGALNRTPLVVYTSADIDPSQLPRLASGETVLFLAERSTSAEVQGRIVDLLAKIGTN
ncbi:PAS domain-containing protein [Streptomyces cinnamoneus]|uniref:hybrid sensor histidine kinase/response regulator n=1 Tax=Streptomyces cinnamoneus TaxID=53446 RepID=UPI00340FCE82